MGGGSLATPRPASQSPLYTIAMKWLVAVPYGNSRVGFRRARPELMCVMCVMEGNHGWASWMGIMGASCFMGVCCGLMDGWVSWHTLQLTMCTA